MANTFGVNARDCRTGLDLITKYPVLYGKDGYYMIYPQGPKNNGILTYCDMTTDGGGWMLAARSHPTGSVSNWGWRGPAIGGVKDFSQPYQLGIWEIFIDKSVFSSFIFGNRNNINNNSWGPFIYKRSGITDFNNFMAGENLQYYTSSVVKTTTSIWNYTGFPGMQGVNGYPISGTSSNQYMMRDCCGLGYGGFPTYMGTTYIGHPDLWEYAGPWGAGSTTDGSGNFIQTTADPKVSGTNQYMIFVK